MSDWCRGSRPQYLIWNRHFLCWDTKGRVAHYGVKSSYVTRYDCLGILKFNWVQIRLCSSWRQIYYSENMILLFQDISVTEVVDILRDMTVLWNILCLWYLWTEMQCWIFSYSLHMIRLTGGTLYNPSQGFTDVKPYSINQSINQKVVPEIQDEGKLAPNYALSAKPWYDEKSVP